MLVTILRAEIKSNIIIQLIQIQIDGVNTYILKAFQIRMLGGCHNIHDVPYGHDERARANEHFSNWYIKEGEELTSLLQ